MTDPYSIAEREAIKWADNCLPKKCEAIEKLEAHRMKVLADRAEKNAKKRGVDRKSLGANDDPQ